MRGALIGIFIGITAILIAMSYVHRQNIEHERELWKQSQRNGVHISPGRVEIDIDSNRWKEPYRDPYRQCRPYNINSRVLLDLHNDTRCLPIYDVHRYTMCPNLCAEAQRCAMRAAREGRFGFVRSGYNYACGPRSEYEVFRHWMRSSQSRDCCTSYRYKMVGFGAAYGIDGRIYWCAVYR